jgi:hypothetical protein
LIDIGASVEAVQCDVIQPMCIGLCVLYVFCVYYRCIMCIMCIIGVLCVLDVYHMCIICVVCVVVYVVQPAGYQWARERGWGMINFVCRMT